MSINVVVLAGNLTRDPELKITPSGTSVAGLRARGLRPRLVLRRVQRTPPARSLGTAQGTGEGEEPGED